MSKFQTELHKQGHKSSQIMTNQKVLVISVKLLVGHPPQITIQL